MSARASMLALLALGCVGCPQPPPSMMCVVDGGAVLEIGNGNPNNPTDYRALTDGASVYLIPGNQGGQHVWIQLHAQNLCPDHPHVRLTVYQASDNSVVGFSQFGGNSWNPLTGSPGTYTTAPMAAAIDEDKYCPLVHGGMIRVAVQVDDQMGHVVMGMVSLTIQGWSPDASPTEQASRDACCADYTNTMCWPLGPPDGAMIDAIDDMAPDSSGFDGE